MGRIAAKYAENRLCVYIDSVSGLNIDFHIPTISFGSSYIWFEVLLQTEQTINPINLGNDSAYSLNGAGYEN